MRTLNFTTCLAALLACVVATAPAQAQTLDELAARGAAVAGADPLAVELRSRAPDDESRRGFDIGMAAAEGNTEPGPGKQRIHDSLPWGEQGGFDAAVSFSLQRNRNARAAATGAAIASADPLLAQARTSEADVFYWLGFDIASGIFGDPAQGAAGNTAMGPGSLGIRNALNPAAQRGFNASVALHLSRNYPRPGGPNPNAASPGGAPVKSLGRVPSTARPGPPISICDAARDARARNSPAAPNLENQCYAELATHGEEIANRNPLTAELRSRAPDDVSRRGFDLGLAVAEKDTQYGPGKQRIHDKLAGREQAAFDAMVALLLELNRNESFAKLGAMISGDDPGVGQARKSENDVFFWLGFDIATGIFGDPARGAQGNTVVGSGALKIRDGLSPAAQRGFNAAVAFHLNRHYPPAPAVAPDQHPQSVAGMPSAVVISQVYGGGGTAGAVLANDFVEILNRGPEAVDLTGWSIQYAAANGAIWQGTALSGTILPGHYYLVQESGSAAAGGALPSPEAVGNIMLAASAGKIALLRNGTLLNGICPASADLMDFLGYGNVNCAEGGASSKEPGRTASALRNDVGCADTDVNAADFQLGAPAPRNETFDPANCAR